MVLFSTVDSILWLSNDDVEVAGLRSEREGSSSEAESPLST